ncbi:MAG TPA: carboxypeptidase-like regulatory domain-containing protein, partial [Candidatus Cloacimonadota bacterium]|nr:carboxypeptidase-like regulatory domain-containing protein [Candidatus Cloacimonadota bacterium]
STLTSHLPNFSPSHALKVSKSLFLILHFTLFIFHFSIVQAIEVGGHLTQDTTWYPVNNPYEVVDNVFVDAGVTLTILPGVEVIIQSAQLTSWDDFNDYFWYQYGNNTAKMIWVNGNIIAEGTVEDSITFTHDQDDFNYYWGCIYIDENSEMPVFKHCIVEYSGGTGIAVGNIARAAITIHNGMGIIKECVFRNNGMDFSASHVYTRNIEVIGCSFYCDIINYFVLHIWGNFHLSISQAEENYKPALVANNYFSSRYKGFPSVFFINNINVSCLGLQTYAQNVRRSYFYNNDYTNCTTGIYGGDPGDSIFIKNNRFINGTDGLDLDEAYVEISENYFSGCGIEGPCQVELIGIVKNNVITNTNIAISGRYEEMFNNIFYNCDKVGSVIGSSNSYLNNLLINNEELCDLLADTPVIENNIFIGNGMDDVEIMNNPIFRNCITDFPIEDPLIDGGGNIIVDSLQAQSIFEDIQNGDFHLVTGSIAIDAGFDTLGYYYPFDLDYNQRVWDGDGNGTAIIDIGPYEYGAPAFGGIQGSTYDPVSGLPVDYVLIKIDNIAGEFTFSDSIGNYEYKLPAGVYDVYAERVFYDDAVEYQIEVFDG